VALRRIYATTAEVEGAAPAVKETGDEQTGEASARPDSGGVVLYDARAARVMEG
jgi:hypothetical protein